MATFLKPAVNHDPHAAHLAKNETITGSWKFDAALIGDLEILKNDPEFKLTDLGGSNSAYWSLSDTLNQMNLYNDVYKPGGPGNGLDFNGTSQYVTMGDPAGGELDFGTSDFSIAIWVNSNDLGSTPRTLLSKHDSAFSDNNGWGLGAVSNTILFFRGDGGAGKIQWTTAQSWNTGEWHHVVLRVEYGVAIDIFLDGIEVSYSNIYSDWASLSNSQDFNFAAQGSSAIRFFYGIIDEIAIWKGKLLSQAEIDDIYNSGSGFHIDKDEDFPSGGSMGTNLVFLQHLNETEMNSAPGGKDTEDSSVNSNHGTAQGGMVDDDFVEGKVAVAGGDVKISSLKVEDGTNPLEGGIVTVGDDINDPRVVFAGRTIRFRTLGTERVQIDANGTLTIDNGEATAQALRLKGANGQSEKIFECIDYLDSNLLSVDYNGDTVVGGTLTVNGDQTGATDHVFDDYDDIALLEKWRAGEKLPFERGDILNRDRLLRDSIVQLNNRVEGLVAGRNFQL